jgi:hypothetical protein
VEAGGLAVRVVRRSLLVVAVVAAFVGALPARADVPTTWSTPVDLEAPPEVGYTAAAGMDAAGTATAIWLADTGTSLRIIRSATRPRGGEWSSPVDRSERVEISDPPSFAQDPAGRAVFAWIQWNGAHPTVHAATIGADGTWADAMEVSAPDESTSYVKASIDDEGHATIAWNVGGAGIKTSTFTFGGAWSPVETLTTVAEATAVEVSSNAAGDVTATWWLQVTHQIFAASRPAGGAWSAPEALSASGVDTEPAVVAQGPGASARAVWREQHGPSWALVGADRSTAGAWSAPADLPGGSAGYPRELRTDPAGATVLVIDDYSAGGPALVASTRAPGGAWSGPAVISPEGMNVLWSDLATNPRGDALVVVDAGDLSNTTTWTRTLPLGGTWSDLARPSGSTVDSQGSIAAMDDRGNAVVTWTVPGAGRPKVQAITSPAPPPAAPAPPPVVLTPRFTG